MTKGQIKLCFCYAEEDEAMAQELSAHLALMERQGILESWHAGKILPGESRDEAIAAHIDQADIILLLLSAGFLASSKCYEDQMARAMTRHHKKQAIVIPVLLRDADYTDAPFSSLQALPRSSLPIASLKDHDPAWREVTQRVRLLTQAPSSPGSETSGARRARRWLLAATGAAVLASGGGFFLIRDHRSAAPPGMISFSERTVTMGSTHNPADAVRTIKLRPFSLDIDEVTNEQFAAWLNRQAGLSVDRGRFVSKDTVLLADLHGAHGGIIHENPGYAPRPGAATRPAVQVTHAAAQAYCEDLHKRLPTENEWELAARGPDLQRTYPWGDEEPTCGGVVFDRTSMGLCHSQGDGPEDVGSRVSGRVDRTPEGVFDLAGNVAEWVHSTALTGSLASSSAEGAAHRRIVRGGDWGRPAASLRGLSRSEITATQALANVGFRCAADVP